MVNSLEIYFIALFRGVLVVVIVISKYLLLNIISHAQCCSDLRIGNELTANEIQFKVVFNFSAHASLQFKTSGHTASDYNPSS